MARIRTLKPEFWRDSQVRAMHRDARLTAIALISAADDRGRLEHSATAIRTYAFLHDHISDRRVQGWLDQVIASGMALAYEIAGYSYLWLPKFWHHQVLNRPSESLLPAHPDDPYGHLPIAKALGQFRDDSVSDSRSDSVSGSVSPHSSRAGARSFPFLSCSAGERDRPFVAREHAELCERLAEQIRARDPQAKVAPDSRRWQDAARLLVEHDGRSIEVVSAVLDWLPTDDFWSSVVLSMPKFREKFTQLVAKQAKPRSRVGAGPAGGHDAVRAERAAALRDRLKQNGAL